MVLTHMSACEVRHHAEPSQYTVGMIAWVGKPWQVPRTSCTLQPGYMYAAATAHKACPSQFWRSRGPRSCDATVSHHDRSVTHYLQPRACFHMPVRKSRDDGRRQFWASSVPCWGTLLGMSMGRERFYAGCHAGNVSQHLDGRGRLSTPGAMQGTFSVPCGGTFWASRWAGKVFQAGCHTAKVLSRG